MLPKILLVILQILLVELITDLKLWLMFMGTFFAGPLILILPILIHERLKKMTKDAEQLHRNQFKLLNYGATKKATVNNGVMQKIKKNMKNYSNLFRCCCSVDTFLPCLIVIFATFLIVYNIWNFIRQSLFLRTPLFDFGWHCFI